MLCYTCRLVHGGELLSPKTTWNLKRPCFPIGFLFKRALFGFHVVLRESNSLSQLFSSWLVPELLGCLENLKQLENCRRKLESHLNPTKVPTIKGLMGKLHKRRYTSPPTPASPLPTHKKHASIKSHLTSKHETTYDDIFDVAHEINDDASIRHEVRLEKMMHSRMTKFPTQRQQQQHEGLARPSLLQHAQEKLGHADLAIHSRTMLMPVSVWSKSIRNRLLTKNKINRGLYRSLKTHSMSLKKESPLDSPKVNGLWWLEWTFPLHCGLLLAGLRILLSMVFTCHLYGCGFYLWRGNASYSSIPWLLLQAQACRRYPIYGLPIFQCDKCVPSALPNDWRSHPF